jgi:threonine dehydrogenase-like Zn-dependent dehydrogenase
MKTQARALWFTKPGRVELREEQLEMETGKIMVESKLQAISHGTEMLLFGGEMPEGIEADETLKPLGGRLQYPIKYGYINTGLTRTGEKVFAFFPHQDIFFVDECDLIFLPQDISFDDAVFLAHMETAVSIIQDASIVFGDTILVLGQGTVGLLIAELLLTASMGKVLTVDRFESKIKMSRKLGCTAFSSEDPKLIDKIYELTQNRGVDRIINVSGSSRALQLGIDTAAFEGTIVEASWYGNRKVTLDLGTGFHRKRLRLNSSQVSRISPLLTGSWDKKRRIRFAIELLQQMKPAKYITHRFSMDRASNAYELIYTHPEQQLQVVLEP